MALLDTEGFGWTTNLTDLTTFGAFATTGNDAALNTSGGPLGDNYLSLSGNPSGFYAARNLPATLTTLFTGSRINLQGLNSNGTYSPGVALLDSAGNEQLSVLLNTGNGTVQVYRGTSASGTLLGTGPANSFPLTGWFYLEIGAVIGASGSVAIRINGVGVLTLTSVNTQATGTAGVSRIGWGTVSQYNYTGNIAFTHYYLCDATGSAPQNTFLGDVRVQTLLPTSNDAVQFTPTGGASNWINAARMPPTSGTYYNADSVVGDQDTFNCAAMSASLGQVYGVTTKTILLKSDSGARTMANVLKSGAAVAVGATVAPGTSGKQFSTVTQTDPNTGAQWTQAGVNAAKPGYRIVS